MLLFFVPEAKALTAELIQTHGLNHLTSPVLKETSRGPAGQAGLFIADSTVPADRLTFNESEQRWSPRYGMTSLVGTWNDHPVPPASLARDAMLPGSSIELLDGHRWTIPLIRQWRASDEQLRFFPALPQVMQQSPDDGRFVAGDVIPAYRELWEASLEIAEQLLKQLTTGGKAELDDATLDNFVCQLLATNYQVDASIISHLQLLSAPLCGSIVSAALDLETLRASLKNLLSRQASGGTNSPSGEQPPAAG